MAMGTKEILTLETAMRPLLITALMVGLVAPLQAGPFFGRKKPTVDPKVRVPELLTILKSDLDAGKRSRAAEELRTIEPTEFPDIVPALIAVLQNDTHQAVRIDAAITLGKYRPVQQVVGEALEEALEKDRSMRVRLQARTQLLQYYWAGYRSSKKEVPPLPTAPAAEPARGIGRFLPPIRTTSQPTPTPTPAPPLANPPVGAPPVRSTTTEPPLAAPAKPPVTITPMPAIKPAPAPVPVPPALGGSGPLPLPPGPPTPPSGPILP